MAAAYVFPLLLLVDFPSVSLEKCLCLKVYSSQYFFSTKEALQNFINNEIKSLPRRAAMSLKYVYWRYRSTSSCLNQHHISIGKRQKKHVIALCVDISKGFEGLNLPLREDCNSSI